MGLHPANMSGYKLQLGWSSGLNLYAGKDKEALTQTEWTLGSAITLPSSIYAEGITTDAQTVSWWLVKTSTSDIVASDTIEINVEKTVWPSNETGSGWQNNPTSQWDGFGICDGWFVEKSLCDMINGSVGYMRTHYPQEKTDTVLGGGSQYSAPMGQESHSGAPAVSTVNYSSGFTMTVTFEFDGPEYMETWQRYVYSAGTNDESPSFFRNSGIYIYDHYEVQIYDTDALMKALNAQDFSAYSVDVDGATRGIRGNVSAGDVNLYHELNQDDTPKYWDRSEPVNGCVSGVPYKKTNNSTLVQVSHILRVYFH